MDDRERRAVGQRQCRRDERPGEASRDQLRLAPARVRERRFGLPLEAPLDDQLRLAVTDEDEGRLEAVGDRERFARRRVLRARSGRAGQWSRPSRMIQSSRTDS